ncbi:hypothetical protein [Pseudooceanicola sp. 200-1SW]|uniref:hypothetical protein n=1 Tax=Pseudooceanicola sp. 200-1SW TaxID=3425949 RepID=UPI003D7F564E
MLDLTEIQNRLELTQWRHRELAAVSDQLEQAFPLLVAQIEDHVVGLSQVGVARAHMRLASAFGDILSSWTEEQRLIAVQRAEVALNALEEKLGERERFHLPVDAVIGLVGKPVLLAASMAAMPTLAAVATVSATSLFFFTTSTVSVPILVAGGVALAVANLSGSTVINRMGDKSRRRLAERANALAWVNVFGDPEKPDGRCLLNDLQVAVLRKAEDKLEAVS